MKMAEAMLPGDDPIGNDMSHQDYQKLKLQKIKFKTNILKTAVLPGNHGHHICL